MFLISILVWLLFYYLISPSPLEAILILLILMLSDFLTLYIVGKKISAEYLKITSIINDIRLNKLKSPDEIILGDTLTELEDIIKSMFLKTRNDIQYLKKLEQTRKEFLGNVSHELRTPIFTIQGYIETLLNGALDDKNVNRSFLEKANNHTQRLDALLNDLIDISMIESGQMRMSFRYFNICSFIAETIKEFQPQAEEKNIDLIFVPSINDLRLFGDKDKLKQVMVNLIQNAIKYTEKGKIEISVKEEKGFGIVSVKDTGIGILAEDVDRIFERFYRVDKDRSRAVGGTGLGLAIVKHILDAHGTNINLKSEPGVGSEFSFKLKK